MKRYYMSASNGSVVAHESETGEWVEFEESQAEVDFWKFGVVRREKIMVQQEADVDRLEKRIKELEETIHNLRHPLSINPDEYVGDEIGGE